MSTVDQREYWKMWRTTDAWVSSYLHVDSLQIPVWFVKSEVCSYHFFHLFLQFLLVHLFLGEWLVMEVALFLTSQRERTKSWSQTLDLGRVSQIIRICSVCKCLPKNTCAVSGAYGVFFKSDCANQLRKLAYNYHDAKKSFQGSWYGVKDIHGKFCPLYFRRL